MQPPEVGAAGAPGAAAMDADDAAPPCCSAPGVCVTGAEAAAARAAARRAAGDADADHPDLDLAAGLAAAEEPDPTGEDCRQHASGGGGPLAIPLTAFNMDAERAAGWFAWATGGGDGGGGFGGGAATAKPRRPRVEDAWADALPRDGPAAMVSDDDDDGDASEDEDGGSDGDDGHHHDHPPPPATVSAERAALRLRLARLLRPGETAVVALRRLAGTDAVVKASSASTPAPATTPTSALARRPPSAQAAFAEVTALCAALMEAGDFDAPTVLTREAILGTGGAPPPASPAGRPASAPRARHSAPLSRTDLPPSAVPAPQRPPAVPFPPGLEGTDFRPVPPPRSLPPSVKLRRGGFWYSTSRGVWYHPATGALGDAGTGAWVTGGVSAADAVGFGRARA